MRMEVFPETAVLHPEFAAEVWKVWEGHTAPKPSFLSGHICSVAWMLIQRTSKVKMALAMRDMLDELDWRCDACKGFLSRS